MFGPHDDVMLSQKLHRAWVLSLLLGVLYANAKEGPSNGVHAVSHWIAEHSYGIYLSHSVVLWVVFYRMEGFPPWAGVTTLVAGTIGIPALLYVSIEKPLILAGGRIARRFLRRTAISEDPQLSKIRS